MSLQETFPDIKHNTILKLAPNAIISYMHSEFNKKITVPYNMISTKCVHNYWIQLSYGICETSDVNNTVMYRPIHSHSKWKIKGVMHPEIPEFHFLNIKL